jgi:pimeloyl-ACP methyl ester carboxylesterase
MEATSRDGVRLRWEANGRGAPVLLVPGRGDSTDLFPDRFSRPLLDAGHQVIRFDPRDTGLSGDGGDQYTMDDDPVGTIIGAMGPTTDTDRAWVQHEVDEAARRAPHRPDVGRHHQEAAYRSSWPAKGQLRDIMSPTLVIHGTGDRKLPMAHADAFVEGIPDSELVVMDGMGHLPRPAGWDSIATHVVRHLARST